MFRSPILAALTALVLTACSSNANDTGSPPPAPTPDASTGQDAGTDAAISHDAAPEAGSPDTLIIEPDQGMQPIYDFIGSATKTLDMTMYDLTDTEITDQLTKLAAAGVKVRVILDQNLEMMDNMMAYSALAAGNVQVHWANPTYAATHQKTITVDRTISAVMSLNLTPDDYATSRDFAIITSNAADVAAIETVFAADFVNAAITPPNGANLVWSPTNSEGVLTGMINGAKTSLLVENEEMGDFEIVNALEAAAHRGVDVQVAMENSSSYQSEFGELVTWGVKLRTYEHAALYIHAKVILADYGTSSATVFMGSENFSNASLTENRELGLVTTDPTIMAGIDKTLASDFAGGTPWLLPATPDAGGTVEAGTDAGATDAGTSTIPDGATD
jgi:cardiolipin synthase A/B